MSPTWQSEEAPETTGPKTVADWLRVIVRGVLVGGTVFGAFAILLLVRVLEAPLCLGRRPLTSRITQGTCRAALRLMGLRHRIEGVPVREGHVAVVSNHVSWLDIFVLNAAQRVTFVAKAEVSGWVGIGWLARGTGTVFITRDPKDAAAQRALLGDRLTDGDKLLFFPEGTSTDGLRVLPFKPTLFQPFFDDHTPSDLEVQPVTLSYRAPDGADPRLYGWWGDMAFGSHLLQTLSVRRQGHVVAVYHQPVPVADCTGRKELARRCEEAVRSGLSAGGT